MLKSLAVLITIIGTVSVSLSLYPLLMLNDQEIFITFVGKVFPFYSYLIFGPVLYHLEEHKRNRRKRYIKARLKGTFWEGFEHLY